MVGVMNTYEPTLCRAIAGRRKKRRAKNRRDDNDRDYRGVLLAMERAGVK
jgi:hypothetical protein